MQEFYRTRFGHDREMYAIAVAHESPDSKLLEMINGILSAKEGQDTVKSLIAKWVKDKCS